jgi:hypothetical protein
MTEIIFLSTSFLGLALYNRLFPNKNELETYDRELFEEMKHQIA